MTSSYLQLGFNLQADDGLIISEDIERLTLAAGLVGMCGLELPHSKGKWNVNKTGANANITDNACTTYVGLVFGEPRVKGMSGHAARVKNIPPQVDCAAPHAVCTAALSPLPPPVRLEQERIRKKHKTLASFETCSAGGKREES